MWVKFYDLKLPHVEKIFENKTGKKRDRKHPYYIYIHPPDRSHASNSKVQFY